MTMPTLATVCDAIDSALSSAAGLTRHQSYDELTEGIPETPLLQTYPEEGEPDLQTYQSYRVEKMTVISDLYAYPRGPGIGQEMAKTATMIDAILTLLRAQDRQAPFDVSVVKFTWSWKRQIFEVSQNKYLGARFTLSFWVRG